jgi:hypothetical protein
LIRDSVRWANSFRKTVSTTRLLQFSRFEKLLPIVGYPKMV